MEFKDLSEEERQEIFFKDGMLLENVRDGIEEKRNVEMIFDDLKNISTTIFKASALVEIIKNENEIKGIENYIVNSDLAQLHNILKNGNDDEKIHLIETIVEERVDDLSSTLNFIIINVLISFQSKDKIVEALSYLKNESCIANLASNIRLALSDECKIYVIDNLLKDEGSIMCVVTSLKSDDKKLEYLSRFQDEHNMKEVVTSLKSEDKVVKCLSKFQDEEIKKEIIENWLYDKQMEALQYINDERFKKRITKEIQERQDEKNLKEEQSQKQNTEQEDELNLEELSLEELSNMSQNLDNEIKKTDDAIEEERKKLIATVLEKRSLLKAKQNELNELKQKNNEFKEQSQGQDLDQ